MMAPSSGKLNCANSMSRSSWSETGQYSEEFISNQQQYVFHFLLSKQPQTIIFQMDVGEKPKQTLSKCPTQESLKSTDRALPPLTSPFQINHTISSPRKKIFTTQSRPSSMFLSSQQERSSSHSETIINNKIQTMQKNQNGREFSEKKLLPQSLRIVYYGPIKNRSLLNTEKRETSAKKQTQRPKSNKVELNGLESRYYDINSTKVSEKEGEKKLSVTYYPVPQHLQHPEPHRHSLKMGGEFIFYGLVMAIGIILMMKAII